MEWSYIHLPWCIFIGGPEPMGFGLFPFFQGVELGSLPILITHLWASLHVTIPVPWMVWELTPLSFWWIVTLGVASHDSTITKHSMALEHIYIYTYIDQWNHPNVDKYAIHGRSGIYRMICIHLHPVFILIYVLCMHGGLLGVSWLFCASVFCCLTVHLSF